MSEGSARPRWRRPGMVLMALGALLVLVAAGIAVFNIVMDTRAGTASAEVLEAFPQTAVHVDEERFDTDAAMPEVTVNGNTYIGQVSAPALGIDLPVMSSWSYAKLDVAPCRYSGSVYADNMVIAGHSYRSHFGPLWRAETGQQVVFTDTVGNIFTYEIVSIERLAPSEVDVMTGETADAGAAGASDASSAVEDATAAAAGSASAAGTSDKGWDLTLFTCTYDSRSRIAVRCARVA